MLLDMDVSAQRRNTAVTKRVLVGLITVALVGVLWFIVASNRGGAPGPVGGGAVATTAPTAPAASATPSTSTAGSREWFVEGTPQGVARGFLTATKSYSWKDAAYGAHQAEAKPYVTAAVWASIEQGLTYPPSAGGDREWAEIQATHRKVTFIVEGMTINTDASTPDQQVVMVRYHMSVVDDTTSPGGRNGPTARISVILVQEGGGWRVTTTSTEAG